jgi:hypothetical protein
LVHKLSIRSRSLLLSLATFGLSKDVTFHRHLVDFRLELAYFRFLALVRLSYWRWRAAFLNPLIQAEFRHRLPIYQLDDRVAAPGHVPEPLYLGCFRVPVAPLITLPSTILTARCASGYARLH